MFKPHTMEQYKVLCYIEEQFVKGSVLISPDSRTALKVTDSIGDSIVFDYRDGHVIESDARPVLIPTARNEYVQQFHSNPDHPSLQNLEDIVRWWHEEERHVSLQQAMNLPDELYHHYLTQDILDTNEICRLVKLGRITEGQYLAVRLWYANGNFKNNWLGPVGTDGTGNLFEVVLNYNTLKENRFRFYVMDEYYQAMNHR